MSLDQRDRFAFALDRERPCQKCQMVSGNIGRVLDTGERVLALRSAVKALSGTDSGKLGDYIGVSSLKPFIDSDLVLGEFVEFSIPGTQFKGSGLTTSNFEMILRAYVRALYEKADLTDRQREIAVKCAVLSAGLIRSGLDALVDEAKPLKMRNLSLFKRLIRLDIS